MLVIKSYRAVAGILLWLILVGGIFAIPLLPQYINKRVDLDILSVNKSSVAIVFFGFQGCGDVCPTTLMTLAQMVNARQDATLQPQIIFVDVEQSSDDKSAHDYAKQFHHSFQGIHVSNQKLAKLSAQFGLNVQEYNGQINHVGKTYLLIKAESGWRLVQAFSPKQVTFDSLQQNLDALSVKV